MNTSSFCTDFNLCTKNNILVSAVHPYSVQSSDLQYRMELA